MKTSIILLIIVILAHVIKYKIILSRIKEKPARIKNRTVIKELIKVKAPDPLQSRKEELKEMQLSNRYNNEIIKREKLNMQAAKIVKQYEYEKFKRYQAQCDKDNLEIEKQDLLRNNYVLSSEKGSEKYNKRIRDLDKKIEKAAFESIEF